MSKIAAFGSNEESLFQTKQSNRTNDNIYDYSQNIGGNYSNSSFYNYLNNDINGVGVMNTGSNGLSHQIMSQGVVIKDLDQIQLQHSHFPPQSASTGITKQSKMAQVANTPPYESVEDFQSLASYNQSIKYQRQSPTNNIMNNGYPQQFVNIYKGNSGNEPEPTNNQPVKQPVVIADFIKQTKLHLKETPLSNQLNSDYNDQEYQSNCRSQPESIKNSNLNHNTNISSRIVTHQGIRQRSISNMRELKNRSVADFENSSQGISNPSQYSKPSSYFSNYSNMPLAASKMARKISSSNKAMLNLSQPNIINDQIQAKIVATDFMNNFSLNKSTSEVQRPEGINRRSSSTAMKKQSNMDGMQQRSLLPAAAEQTVQTLNNHFCIEMGKAKPKILKNLNSLYQVFVPQQSQKKTSSADIRKSEFKNQKNRSMDITNPQYYITFNKDSNQDSLKFASQLQKIMENEQPKKLNNQELYKSRQELSTGLSQQQSAGNRGGIQSLNGTKENLENQDSILNINQLLRNLSPDRALMQHSSQNEILYHQNDYFDNESNDEQKIIRSHVRKGSFNTYNQNQQSQSRDQKKFLSQIFWQSQSQQQVNAQSATNINMDQYMLSPQIPTSGQKPPRHSSGYSQDYQQQSSQFPLTDFNNSNSQEFTISQNEQLQSQQNPRTIHNLQPRIQQRMPQIPFSQQLFSQSLTSNQNLNTTNAYQSSSQKPFNNGLGQSAKKVHLNNDSINNYETDMQIQSTATFSQLVINNDKEVKDTPRIGQEEYYPSTVKTLIK